MLFGLLSLAVILLILFFIPGYTPKIKNLSNSIAELSKVKLGGTDQWILIRSENIDNPIILFVHGGPGTSQLTQSRNNTRSIEKHFTIVNWDQRGAGKSFNAIRDKSGMNIDQFISDIHELTEYLLKRFNKKKIIIAGHSWGSVIGILAVSKRPELYDGYIGIGQMSNVIESERISYSWTIKQAELEKDLAAIKKLDEMGSPPYTGNWRKKFMTQRRILGKYGGEYYGSSSGAFPVVFQNLILSTEYTLVDRINFFRGILGSVKLIFPELLKINLFDNVKELKLPVWFMEGRHDYEVPSVLAEKYFGILKAPFKKLYWFENSAHLPNTEEKDLFNKILVEEILPVIYMQEKVESIQ